MESLLPSFVYIGGFLLSLFMIHMPNRQLMLASCVTYSCLYAMSFVMQGEMAGAMASLLAAGIVMVNAVVPEHKLGKTFKFRLFTVGILCLGAACFSVRGAADILPFLAMMCARFSETLNTQQKIRKGYALSGALWLGYIISTGNIILISLETGRWLNVLMTLYLKRERPASGIPEPAKY